MRLDQKYNRAEFLLFLKSFIPAFNNDIRPVSLIKLKVSHEVTYLGKSEELDLDIFEITHSSTSDARVSLAMDGFKVMKNSSIYRALVVYRAERCDDWRLSLMTATPSVKEKVKVGQTLSNPRRFSYFLGPKAKVNTPKRFINKEIPVKDFADLQKRFSLEVVNKEFYKKIQESYYSLVGGTLGEGKRAVIYKPLLHLPSQADRNQECLEFAVRLIGRIIFCWFLREKKGPSGTSLMPNELLSLNAAKKQKVYYHKTLEPIFFELLNKPIKSRMEEYAGKFYSLIPYLNGGLFTPHDGDFYKRRNGEQSIYHNTLKIPDKWFADLFETLELYNFTIDENSSFDEELSIDPEMLGRIFENLLAEINPETGESARKSTGSYYTPRPIVDYMVDESLFQYLKQKTNIEENKLRAIISYDLSDDALSPLDKDEKMKIVDALDELKLLDPACGSGAFPIGALQKIVFILQQIDPEGQLWFKKQIKATSPEISRVIEREFSHKNFDYIRKLGIIRANLFGIDIQPIATEISRLRCFLTLVVDERVDDSLENRGIEPLPNLDFKFVTANSLIGLPASSNEAQVGLFDDEEGIKDLKEIRDSFFNAYGAEREQLKLQFVQKQNQMFHKLISRKSLGHAELTTKLTGWEPFSNQSSSWFDPEWMFGADDGFDIVIANPPYGADLDKELVKAIQKEIKDTKNMNSAALFVDFGKNKYLKKDGVLTFIVPKSLLYSERWFALVKAMLGKVNVLIDVEKAFEKVLLEQVVFVFSGSMMTNSFMAKKFKDDAFVQTTVISNDLVLELQAWICDVSSKEISILKKVLSGRVLYMRDIAETKRGVGLQKHLMKNGKNPIIGGANIFRYGIDGVKGYLPDNVINNETKKVGFMRQKKIVSQDVIAHIQNPFPHIKLMSCLDSEGDIFGLDTVQNTIIFNEKYDSRYILAILNSLFASWYTYKFIYCSAIRTMHFDNYYIGKIPIPDIAADKQKTIVNAVDRILALNKSGNSCDDAGKQAKVREYEKQIDQMVYKLYGLTPEEIEVVEGTE